ncbi:MAG: hypothetical protein AAGE05_01790 [Pseudomonadota bacterium]
MMARRTGLSDLRQVYAARAEQARERVGRAVRRLAELDAQRAAKAAEIETCVAQLSILLDGDRFDPAMSAAWRNEFAKLDAQITDLEGERAEAAARRDRARRLWAESEARNEAAATLAAQAKRAGRKAREEKLQLDAEDRVAREWAKP